MYSGGGSDSNYVSWTATCRGICFVHPALNTTRPTETSTGTNAVTTQSRTSTEQDVTAVSGKIINRLLIWGYNYVKSNSHEVVRSLFVLFCFELFLFCFDLLLLLSFFVFVCLPVFSGKAKCISLNLIIVFLVWRFLFVCKLEGWQLVKLGWRQSKLYRVNNQDHYWG